ncbi:MAG: preprotein translocase subunit SecE [Prevotella sp.]|jgi:preprotein translocase subunit SecE
MFKKIVHYCKFCVDYCKVCYDELAHKVTWPTRKELTHSAGVVLMASLVIALIVFIMDTVFKNFMLLIYPN